LKEEAQDRTFSRTQFGRGYGPLARQTTTWLESAWSKEWSTLKPTLIVHLHNIRINIILHLPSGLEIFQPKFSMYF
jgi:hypothetical protein